MSVTRRNRLKCFLPSDAFDLNRLREPTDGTDNDGGTLDQNHGLQPARDDSGTYDMSSHDGIMAGGWRRGHSARAAAVQPELRSITTNAVQAAPAPISWLWIPLGILAITIVLAFLPGRTRIAPIVESDYCYLLIAADRMFAGSGLTTPPPVAPLQPWSWQNDWVFLTQWPIGYPLLVCAFRWTFGLSSIQACQWIGLLACATALAGWFAWIKRSVPCGVTGILLSAVGAGCAVSTASLLNPSTDMIFVALLPFVLLLTTGAIERLGSESDDQSKRRGTLWLALAGLTAGGLFWIRYAAVFVPLAVGVYLIVEWYRHRPLVASPPPWAT